MPQHKMTMHEIGMATAQKAALLTSHMKMVRKKTETVPKVGMTMPLDHNGIMREDRDGQARTPTIKVRYDTKQGKWVQVRPLMAGLHIFMTSDPQPHHTKIRVVSIVPSGRACYAEPVE